MQDIQEQMSNLELSSQSTQPEQRQHRSEYHPVHFDSLQNLETYGNQHVSALHRNNEPAQPDAIDEFASMPLDFSNLQSDDVLDNFDFDSFLQGIELEMCSGGRVTTGHVMESEKVESTIREQLMHLPEETRAKAMSILQQCKPTTPVERKAFLVDYQRDLRALEEQQKPRLLFARQGHSEVPEEIEKDKEQPTCQYRDQAIAALVLSSPCHLQDSQIELMLREQQSKKRLLQARREQDDMAARRPTDSPQRMDDFQMQPMLLEQQNKKRLLQARQEQDDMVAESPSTSSHALQDYHMQLYLLDQQNKRRERERQRQADIEAGISSGTGQDM